MFVVLILDVEIHKECWSLVSGFDALSQRVDEIYEVAGKDESSKVGRLNRSDGIVAAYTENRGGEVRL